MGTNEASEQLRSLNDNHEARITFVNTTPSVVEIFWISYKGRAVRYGILNPNDRTSVDTYATHPWIFLEQETRDRFLAKGKDVFLPEPWFQPYLGMTRDQLPRRLERVEVFISLPIYTLRDLSLRAIKRRLQHDHHAFLLEIPQSLQYELASMPPRKGDPAEP